MRLSAAVAVAVLLAGVSRAEPPPVSELVQRLESEDPEERASARDGLRDAGAAAVAALEKIVAAGGPRARVAGTILRQIAFDERAAAAMAGGTSWYRWERGNRTAWVRLDAERTKEGWTLRETVHMDAIRLTVVTETDRDFRAVSLVSTLVAGGSTQEVKATFSSSGCTVDDGTDKTPLPGSGTPLTDWTVLRFAPSLAIVPPHEPEMMVWDSLDAEPASTYLRFGEPEIVAGPAGNVRARGVKIEGLMTVWVKDDGTVSHATRGEGSRVVPVPAADVPEDLRK